MTNATISQFAASIVAALVASTLFISTAVGPASNLVI